MGLVVVDQHYDVQAINLAARRLLEIHTAALGEDLVHLAQRLPAERLRTAINRALEGQVVMEQFTVPSLEGPQAARHQLEVQCSPHRTGGATEPIRQVLLLITHLGMLAADRQEQEQRASQTAQLDQLTGQVRQRASHAEQPEVREILRASQVALETAQVELAQRAARAAAAAGGPPGTAAGQPRVDGDQPGAAAAERGAAGAGRGGPSRV